MANSDHRPIRFNQQARFGPPSRFEPFVHVRDHAKELKMTLALCSLPAVDDDSCDGFHRRSQTLFEAKISLRELFHLRARLTERV
jgi:hypothetical protein